MPLGSIVMLQSYDDISLLAPGVDVAVSLGDLLERIAPINDRSEFSRLSQPREKTEAVILAFGGQISSPSMDLMRASGVGGA